MSKSSPSEVCIPRINQFYQYSPCQLCTSPPFEIAASSSSPLEPPPRTPGNRALRMRNMHRPLNHNMITITHKTALLDLRAHGLPVAPPEIEEGLLGLDFGAAGGACSACKVAEGGAHLDAGGVFFGFSGRPEGGEGEGAG